MKRPSRREGAFLRVRLWSIRGSWIGPSGLQVEGHRSYCGRGVRAVLWTVEVSGALVNSNASILFGVVLYIHEVRRIKHGCD